MTSSQHGPPDAPRARGAESYKSSGGKAVVAEVLRQTGVVILIVLLALAVLIGVFVAPRLMRSRSAWTHIRDAASPGTILETLPADLNTFISKGDDDDKAAVRRYEPCPDAEVVFCYKKPGMLVYIIGRPENGKHRIRKVLRVDD